MPTPPKVAIVHDWMLLGGAEKVVEQLLLMYPEAPLYTSCISPMWQEKLKNRTVITGYLNGWFFKKIRKFVPFLRQRWFEKLDLSGYDIVISSSGAEAKGINVPAGTVHINYCHAPTHYYWSRYEQYLRNPGFGPLNWLARAGLKMLVKPMRKWDYTAAQKPHVIVANSSHIAAEIKKYYGRTAEVIFPPVEVAQFTKTKAQSRSGFVVAARHIPYKRLDLAVLTCKELDLPLTVIGDGPERARLQNLAGPKTVFTGMYPQEKLIECYHRSAAFIFPGLDDFGIAPVEAIAAGCPVIAYKAGGALDYVQPGKTGLFFEEQTVESLVAALKKFQQSRFSESVVAKEAEMFSPAVFREKMSDLVSKCMARHIQ